MARRKALVVCPTPGCPELTDGGPCASHKRAAEQRRGTAAERGYSGRAWQRARRAVLMRDPICKVCGKAFSTVADHHPHSRRELVAMGVRNPDAPERMRGLCAPCHG